MPSRYCFERYLLGVVGEDDMVGDFGGEFVEGRQTDCKLLYSRSLSRLPSLFVMKIELLANDSHDNKKGESRGNGVII